MPLLGWKPTSSQIRLKGHNSNLGKTRDLTETGCRKILQTLSMNAVRPEQLALPSPASHVGKLIGPCKGVLLTFFKKSEMRACSNHRGISLVAVGAKPFTALHLKSFLARRDPRTRPSQSGLRPGRVCVNQIIGLRRTLEQQWCLQQPNASQRHCSRLAMNSCVG